MDMQAQQQSHPHVREASQADLQHWRQHPEEYWTGVAAALLCTHCPTRTGWGPESWSTLQLIAFDAVGLGAVMHPVHDVEQACTELLRVADGHCLLDLFRGKLVQVSCFWQCYKLPTPGDLDAGHSLTAADHYFELITQQQTHQQHEYKPRTDMYKITGHK